MPENNTVVIMVSVGNRSNLSDYTYPRLSNWAVKQGYSCILLKKNNAGQDRSPHFNKLIAHKDVPFFDRYIIVDDDILVSSNAPAIPEIPAGLVGLAKDAEQGHTEASQIKWTANSGLMVVNKAQLYLLEEAYIRGEYPYKCGDKSGKGIWGPHDQGIINQILFENESIYQLDWNWNYQPILDYFINRGGGWDKWQSSRFTRIYYYLSLLVPFSRNRKLLNQAFCIHLIRSTYTSFFDKIIP